MYVINWCSTKHITCFPLCFLHDYQFASCYVQPLQLFGQGTRRVNYLSLLTYHGPHCTPQPRIVCHTPRLTLRQICHMLKVMRQDAARWGATQLRKRVLVAALPHTDTTAWTSWFHFQTFPTSRGYQSDNSLLKIISYKYINIFQSLMRLHATYLLNLYKPLFSVVMTV